jgi:hypothetical protein
MFEEVDQIEPEDGFVFHDQDRLVRNRLTLAH